MLELQGRKSRHRQILHLIAVMRKAKAWGLADSQKRGVVEYPPSQARSSSLGLETAGGKAILKRLGLDVVRPRRSA